MVPAEQNPKATSLLEKVLLWVSALGTLVTVVLPIFAGDSKWLVFTCALSLTIAAVLYYLIVRLLGGRIPRQERLRNAHFLASATDSQSKSNSARRTAVACYAIELTQTEGFLCELNSLKERILEYHRDAVSEYEHSPRAIAQFQKIIDDFVRDCVYIEAHSEALKLLRHESCGRYELWVNFKTSFHEFWTHVKQVVLRPLTQASKRERIPTGTGVHESPPRTERIKLEQERRKSALHDSATQALLASQTRLEPLRAEVTRVRDQLRAHLHGML